MKKHNQNTQKKKKGGKDFEQSGEYLTLSLFGIDDSIVGGIWNPGMKHARASGHLHKTAHPRRSSLIWQTAVMKAVLLPLKSRSPIMQKAIDLPKWQPINHLSINSVSCHLLKLRKAKAGRGQPKRKSKKTKASNTKNPVHLSGFGVTLPGVSSVSVTGTRGKAENHHGQAPF